MNPLSTTSGARLKKAVAPSVSPQPVEPTAPAAGERVSVNTLQNFQDLQGIFFDPFTGKAYKEDGTYSGYTFEVPRWTGPFGLAIQWQFLNPLSFATAETAEKIRAMVEGWLAYIPNHGHGWIVKVEEQKVVGPFTRTVERQIRVYRFEESGRFHESSAGMLANALIRNPEEQAKRSFFAEMRQSGFSEV